MFKKSYLYFLKMVSLCWIPSGPPIYSTWSISFWMAAKIFLRAAPWVL